MFYAPVGVFSLAFDSFAPKGGEDILQRCMNLTNNAQNLDFPGANVATISELCSAAVDKEKDKVSNPNPQKKNPQD